MQLRAMAKINLGLDITAKRPDGYHEVRMIMQTIWMYDRLELLTSREKGVQMRTNLPYLPTDERNLCVRAAKLLMETYGIDAGVTIDLHKVIPVAAGLAGGSSDAAATLVGMDRLFGLGLSQETLMRHAATLGADVPYCVMRGTALAEGIGERLTPLPDIPDCRILIAKPGISLSTKEVYEAFRLDEVETHPDIDGMAEAIRLGEFTGITERVANVLELVALPKHPVIGQIRDLMIESGADATGMSGSGPTVFGIFRDQTNAEQAEKQMKKSGLARRVFLTRPFVRGRRE